MLKNADLDRAVIWHAGQNIESVPDLNPEEEKN
jgi:hypothetical protein